jgi:hypothetical protein
MKPGLSDHFGFAGSISLKSQFVGKGWKSKNARPFSVSNNTSKKSQDYTTLRKAKPEPEMSG